MTEEIKELSQEEKEQMLDYLCHRGQFLNQIEVFDNLWDELMVQPFQVSWLRLLRINIRRLRSAVMLVEPILPPQGQEWLQFLKTTAAELGSIREYDVAIKGCEKYEAIMENDDTAEDFSILMGMNVPRQLNSLKQLVQQRRDVQCQLWLERAKVGWISEGLDDFMYLLEREHHTSEANVMKAKVFFNARLKNWGQKMCEKLMAVTSDSPMNDIHKLRIKIKRYRYSYDVFMRYSVDMELLESLKAMQDLLGYIRDRERNITVMGRLVATKSDTRLQQEFACYKAWSEKEINKKLRGFDALRLEVIEQIQLNLDRADFSH